MTLENQVCSLELAKRLKELGVKQESVFVYIKTKHAKGIYYVTEAIKPLLSMPDTEWYAAFTVAELGELMHRDWRTHKKDNQAWFYNRHGEKNGRMFGPFPTEADARAICIIRRLERLKVDEINNALSPKI